MLNVKGFNLPGGRGAVSYSVENAFGKPITSGKVELKDGSGHITLPASQRGYFKVDCKAGSSSKSKMTSYVVIEPVKMEYIPDSRFGCHALVSDGYRIRNWQELQETTMRRAFLAGAKWVRHHSLMWFLREPEKGKYDWTFFDDRLALAEKYKMNFMLTLGGPPNGRLLPRTPR